MAEIHPIKYLKDKINRINKIILPGKPQNIEEAASNLLNFIVREKREHSLKGRAHLLEKPEKKISDISKFFRKPKEKESK